ncbi:MAG TPA: ATP-binding protein, partial [Candidatus Limnocylindrales bacterium]|nr:ATP-binding protein [Candidatus Limnocylindrales bacterium]
HADTVVEVGKVPGEPGEALKDSLTERGSYNFSDIGSWIWAAETADRQTVRFWTTFEIPRATRVTKARLRITGDNEYILFLDGQELGRDAEWRHLYEYDITALLKPGHHVLAVEGYNSSREAGMLLGLRIGLADGRVVGVKSDESWRIVPENVSGWQAKIEAAAAWTNATVVGKLGSGYWGMPNMINLVPPLAPVIIPFWKTGWFQLTLLAVCVMVTLISFRLLAQVVLQKKEQQLLRRERARIARDIHDDLGTRVTQIVLQGEVALSEQPPGSQTHAQLDRISEEAREALGAMDEILWAINPRRDTLHEFATFVCAHAQTFLKATPIQCVLDVEPGMSTVAFDLPFRRSLLLAVKEAITNAAKHSQATELLLQIRRQGDGLTVVVQDNGKGFDLAQAGSERNGLDNMIQRMDEVGGTCIFTSQPGNGCRVEFYIPFIQMRRRSWWLDWHLGQSPDQTTTRPD